MMLNRFNNWLDSLPEWAYAIVVFSIPFFLVWVSLGGLQ